mgnify:CR=1 FL=1
MDQNNGGIIGKINTPTTTVASGVWSLDSQFEAQSSSIWPLAFPQTTIVNSLRVDTGSSAYLTRTESQDQSDGKKITISVWCKLGSQLGTTRYFFGGHADGSYTNEIGFTSNDQLNFSCIANGTNQVTTNRVFRDVSAWYHIVGVLDSTQGTSTDRIKLYVNGVEETSFSSSSYPSENAVTEYLKNGGVTRVGDKGSGGNNYDGYLAEINVIDGQALDQTSFGIFNTVSNIWEPRAYTGTYGNNGFRLDFADSSALGNDVSGNNSDFTANNLTSIDQATDTCSNNFATMNPLAAQGGSGASSSVVTFTEGNLVVDAIISETAIANIGVDTGKWYWEVKVLTDQDGLAIGAANQHFDLDAELGYNSPSSPSDAKVFGYYGGNGNKFTTIGDGSQLSSYGDAIAVNDIIGVALNLDDDEVIFYKNGTAQNSGTAISLTALGSGEQYFPAVGNWSGSAVKLSFNFGSPQFSISSGNADANNHGNFEYAVPSGYFALCTKNLAEFG